MKLISCTLKIIISLLALYIFSINVVDCKCQNGQISCKERPEKCINKEQLNDGVVDCPLGTDEKPKRELLANGRMSLDSQNYKADNDNEDKQLNINNTIRHTEKRRLNTLNKHRLTNNQSNSLKTNNDYLINNHEKQTDNHSLFPNYLIKNSNSYKDNNNNNKEINDEEEEDSLDELLTEHLHNLAHSFNNEHNSNLDSNLDSSLDASSTAFDDHHLNDEESNDDGLSFLIDHHSLPEDELNSAALQLSLLMEADHSSSLLKQFSNSDQLIKSSSILNSDLISSTISSQLLNSKSIDFTLNSQLNALSNLDNSISTNLLSPSFSSIFNSPTINPTSVISSLSSLEMNSFSLLSSSSSLNLSLTSFSSPYSSYLSNKTEQLQLNSLNTQTDTITPTPTITQIKHSSTLSFVLLQDNETIKRDSSIKQSNKLEYNVQGETSSKSKLDQELNDLDKQPNLFFNNLLITSSSTAVADFEDLASSSLTTQSSNNESTLEMNSSTEFIPSSVRRSDSDELMLTKIVDNSKNKKQSSTSNKRKQQKVIIRPILPVDYSSMETKLNNEESHLTTPTLPIKSNELSARKIGEQSGLDILIDPISPSISSNKRVFTKTIGNSRSNYDDLNEYIPYLHSENSNHVDADSRSQITMPQPKSNYKFRPKLNQNQSVTAQQNSDSFLARINYKQTTSATPNYEIKSRTTLYGFAHFTTVISGTEIVFSPSSTGYQPHANHLSTANIQPTSTFSMNTANLNTLQPNLSALKEIKQNQQVQSPQNIIKPSKTRNFLIKTKSRIIYRNQNNQNNPLISNRNNQILFKNNQLVINPLNNQMLNKNNLNQATPPLILNNNLIRPSILPVSSQLPQIPFNYVTKQPQTKPSFSINVLPNKIKMLPIGIISTINGPRSINFNAITEYKTLVIGTYIHGTYAHLLQTTSNIKPILATMNLPQITITSGFILPSHLLKNQFESNIKPTKSVELESIQQSTQLNNLNNSINKDQSTKILLFTPAITVFSTQTHYTTLFRNGLPSISTRKEIVSSIISPSATFSPSIIDSTSSILDSQIKSISTASHFIESSKLNPIESSKIDSSLLLNSKTLPLSNYKMNNYQSSSPPLELTIYTTLVKDGKTTLSSSIATLSSTIEKLSTDDEVGEIDEEQLPKPTLTATTTFYTTFTYFTTLYSNSTKIITSNYETISNVVSNEVLSSSLITNHNLNDEIKATKRITEPIVKTSIINSDQLTKVESSFHNTESSLNGNSLVSPLSSNLIGRSMDQVNNHLDNTILNDDIKPTADLNSLLIGVKLPVTHYTTFTYYTTLFKDNKPSIITRTEIISNIVTDTLNIKPTISSSYLNKLPATTSFISDNKQKNENKNDLLITSGSQLESHLQLPPSSSFGGRLDTEIRTPPLAQLPKPNAQIDLDKLTPEQKKQLLLLRPDLFRKKLQTVYTTYTSSKTHLLNGSPSIEVLYATVTNIIAADGQTPYTVGNSVDQDSKFQLPITSSSTHHVILRSRSDAPSVTHQTTITHFTTYAQGNDLITATRKETKSDIRPNPALMISSSLPINLNNNIGLNGQRRPIIIRRTKSRVFNNPSIQATRIHPDQARLGPIVVVTKQQQIPNHYASRVQQQLQLQQQQQLRQLAALKQQQIALQKQQEITIKNHYNQVIKQQQMQRTALQGRQANLNVNDKSVEIVNHNAKLSELRNENAAANENVSNKNGDLLITTTQQSTTKNITNEKERTTDKSTINLINTTTTTTEKPSSSNNTVKTEINTTNNKIESTTTTSLLTTLKLGDEKLNKTSETTIITVTTLPTTAIIENQNLTLTTTADSILNKTELDNNNTINQDNKNQTGSLPILKKRRLFFVELEEENDQHSSNLDLPSPIYVHEIQNKSTNTDSLLLKQINNDNLNKPSTKLADNIPPTSNFSLLPDQTISSLSLSSDVLKSTTSLNSNNIKTIATAAAAVDKDENDKKNGEQMMEKSNLSVNGMYLKTMNRSPLFINDDSCNNKFLKTNTLINDNNHNNNKLLLPINKHNINNNVNKQNNITLFNYFKPTTTTISINSSQYFLHSSAESLNTTTKYSYNTSNDLSTTNNVKPTLTTEKSNNEITGLVSTIKSTLIIEELTIVYTTEYYGTFINGIYAHLAKTKSEVISSTPTQDLFNGVIFTQPPSDVNLDSIKPTQSTTFLNLETTTTAINIENKINNSINTINDSNNNDIIYSSQNLNEQQQLATSTLELPISSISSNLPINSDSISIFISNTEISSTEELKTKESEILNSLSSSSSFKTDSQSSTSIPEINYSTGLISQSNSTQIIDDTTSIYNTQIIGTYFNGLYAHIGKVSVSVIQPSQTLAPITKTESPFSDLKIRSEISSGEQILTNDQSSSKQSTPSIDNKKLITSYNSDQLTDHAETINGEFKIPLQIYRSSEIVYNSNNIEETSQPIYTIYHLAKVYKTNIGDFEAQFTVSSSFSVSAIESTSTNYNPTEEISRRFDDTPSIGLLSIDRNRLLNEDALIDSNNNQNIIPSHSSLVKPSIHFPKRNSGNLKRKPFLPIKSQSNSLILNLKSSNGLLVNSGVLNERNEKLIKFTDFDDEYSDLNDDKTLDRSSIHDTEYLDTDYENGHETVARSSSNHPMAKHRLTRDESTQYRPNLEGPTSNTNINEQNEDLNLAEMYRNNQNRVNAYGFNGRGSLRNSAGNQVASASSNRQHQRRYGSAFGERSDNNPNNDQSSNNNNLQATRRQRISPYQFDQLIGNTQPNINNNNLNQNIQSQNNQLISPNNNSNNIRYRGFLTNNQQISTSTSTTTTQAPTTPNINPLNNRRKYRIRNQYQPSTTSTTTQNPLRLQRQNRRKLPTSQQITQQPRGGKLRTVPTQSDTITNDQQHNNNYERGNQQQQRRRSQQQSQQNQSNNRKKQYQNTFSTRGFSNNNNNNNFNYDKIQYSTLNRQLEPSILSPDDFIGKNGNQGFIPTTTLNKIPVTITSLVPVIKTLPIKHGFKTSYATLTTTTFNTSIIRPDQYQTKLDSNNLANTVSIYTEYIDPLNPTKVTQVIITTTAIQEVKLVPIKIGFNTRTDTLTSVQILTTLHTNYLSTNGYQTLLQTATAPPGYTLQPTSYLSTVTQLSSFVVSLVLHGKTLLSTLSTSILLPTTVHTFKTVPINPTTSIINLNEPILTTQLTITLTGDNGELTQLVTAVTIPQNLIQPTITQQNSLPSILMTADPLNRAINNQNNNNNNNAFKFLDGDIPGAETNSSPTYIRPRNDFKRSTTAVNYKLRPTPPTQSINNRNNLKLNNLSFKYNYTASHSLPTLTNFNKTHETMHYNTTNTIISTTSYFPSLSLNPALLIMPTADLSQKANYSGRNYNLNYHLNKNSVNHNQQQSTNILNTNISLNTFNKGNHTSNGTTVSNSRTTTTQATRHRQNNVTSDKNLRKRPNKKQAEKFAAASLASAYKQKSQAANLQPQQPQPSTFQKRKLFQFTDDKSLDDSNEPAAIPLQPNRVRQRLANAQQGNNGFQRVNVRTAAASNPSVRRLTLTPNFLENFGNINSSPNENPTSRFQRIVNSALTHSTPSNSLLNDELLAPATFLNQPNRQPINLPNPLVLDLNSFSTPNDASNIFGTNQPTSILNEEHLINLDTPRRGQFNRIKPNNVLSPFSPLNSLDFLNPIASVAHNPAASNRRQNNQRKPSQASRVRIPSSQLFLNTEAALNPFSPSRSIDFNNFNSYNVEPAFSRLPAAEISANVPDFSVRIQPSSVLNNENSSPTASKRLVRVRRPNNSLPPTTGTTPSLPSSQTTPTQNSRRRVNVNRNKNDLSSTQGRGPLNGVYTDDELINFGNNAIDIDDNLLSNLNSKLNPVQLEPSKSASGTANSKDESVLVNYQTIFTYLTTVIKGQHTLFTSRLSTTHESSTKSVDDELSAQLEKGTVIQPTETVNLATKTKGVTTTIVNMQSQVNIENFKPIQVTPTLSPALDQNNLQPTRIKLLEKPDIVVDDPTVHSKHTPKLNLDQIRQAARVLQTEYRYIYTVYDSTHTKKSTRNEAVTNTLSQPLDLHNMEIDSTVDSNGYLRLGSVNGEIINLGKRVKSGLTTEVNLQLKTLAKLDGLANHKVEVTSAPVVSSIQPTSSSSVNELSSTSVAHSRTRSSLRVVSSRVSSVQDPSTVQPSKSKIAVRIRKPIYSRIPGSNANKIVSSRVSNTRLHLSTSDQPIEPSKSLDLPNSSATVSLSSNSNLPIIESSANSIDLHSSSLLQPTTPISISPAESSNLNSLSKKRVVTITRKPLIGNFNRLRTQFSRKPAVSSSIDLMSSDLIESSSFGIPSSTARFSLYSRFTVSHHSSSITSISSSSIQPSSTVSSSIAVIPTSSNSAIRQFTRSRIVSSRVIKTKSIQPLDKTSSSQVETTSSIKSNPSLSTIYSTATHTIPFTIGSKTLYTTFEITNSKVEMVNQQSSIIPSSSLQSLAAQPSSVSSIQPSSASDVEKTMFTTFTYFTTFYQSGGASKIVSSESTMSNVITVPASDLLSPSAIQPSSSIVPPEQSFTLSSAPSVHSVSVTSIQPTPSLLPIYVTEHSEKTETSTILNTITYFATLYNGTKSTITPITEVKTELLTLREPIKITRTIHPLVGGQSTSSAAQPGSSNELPPRNVFVRTYYTTYTNPITLFNSDGPTTSNVEEIVSNVITFTLPGQRPSSSLILPTTSTIDLMSIKPSSSIQSINDLPHSRSIHHHHHPEVASVLVPSVSTLYRTHTMYTTVLQDGNPSISSKESVTSSLITIFVPQSQASSSVNAKLPLDPVMTMYTTYTFYTTKQPNEIVSSLSTATQYVTVSNSQPLPSPTYSSSIQDKINPTPSFNLEEQFMKSSINLPESGNSPSVNVDNVLSSIMKDEISSSISSSFNELPMESSVLTSSSTSKLPAIFDTNVGGKSTTVIDGSTVVFFTDFIFPSSSSDNSEVHSATETNHIAKGPAGSNINLVVDNSAPYDEHPHLPKDPTKDESDLVNKPDTSTSIKPGQVIELSDILGSSSIGGSLSDTIKDIVQLIAANTNKLNKNGGGGNQQDSKDAPVYLPNPPLYKDQVNSVFIENPVLASDQIGVHQHQRPHIESSISPSFVLNANGNLEASFNNNNDESSSVPTNPLFKSSSSIDSESTARPALFPENSEQPVSTKYLTSVESSTRTLTLTTTKVYYTRDSPLTITSVLTTTIKPRTFVTTIIGSRTILGTAGDQTKTLDINDSTQQLNNLQQTTTVTTTTLTFNSITTTVVRTLVLPSISPSNIIQPSKTQIAKIPATKLPTGAGSVTPAGNGSQNKRKPYMPNFKGPGRQSTTPASVKISPKDARTRAPFKPKPPVASNVPPRFATPKPKPSSTTTTTTTTEKPKVEVDQCRPSCNLANKEICKEFSGIFKCDCRPGFAKKTGSNICEEIQTYALLLRVTKLGDNLISYDDLEDDSGPDFNMFKKQTKHQVDYAYRQSTIKDNYIGADINWINQTLNTDGVYVNLTLKLTQMEGVNESMLKEEFVKSLNDINVNADKQRHQPTTLQPIEDETHSNGINSIENSNKTLSVPTISIPASTNMTIQVNNSNGTQSKPILQSMLATVEALTDVDECSSNELNDCGGGAICINSVGSYRCMCVDGFADLQPSLPGRVCSSELKQCDFCNQRGDCIRESNGNITCRCAKRYLGRNCEINGFMLTIMLPVTVIFAIITFCCVAYCCRKYRKRNNYSKGFKNMVNFNENNLSANISASTLDRKAMLETSSESSEHFRHVYDGPGALLPDLNGSTRRVRPEHMMDIANLNLMPPGSRSQLAANMTASYGYNAGANLTGSPNVTNPNQQYAGGFGTIPPQIVIPRVRNPNQNSSFRNNYPHLNEDKMQSLDIAINNISFNNSDYNLQASGRRKLGEFKINNNAYNYDQDILKEDLNPMNQLNFYKTSRHTEQDDCLNENSKRIYRRNSAKFTKYEWKHKTINAISDLDEDDLSNSPNEDVNLYSTIKKQNERHKSKNENLMKEYLNRNAVLRQNSTSTTTTALSIKKIDSFNNKSSIIRRTSTNQSSNMNDPLLINRSKQFNKLKQLPMRTSNDTLNRTSDTFKNHNKNLNNLEINKNTFSNLSTLKKHDNTNSRKLNNNNQTQSRKFYLDEKGNKISVINNLEDFLKIEDDKEIDDDEINDIQSTCSSNLRDLSLNLKDNWGRLPFYDKD